MATVSGMATSYDLPQYIGELFQKTERPNALLRLIGGLTGTVRTVQSTQFPMGVDYVLPSAAQPAILEGADPTPSELDTAQSSNLVQIFQESVKLAYSKLGEQGSINGVAIIPGVAGHGTLVQPGSLAFQVNYKLQKIARDANYSFLRGAYQLPADNTTARKTRGIRTAVTTNLFANGGTARTLDKSVFENALRDSMNNGMFSMGAELFCMGDATQIQRLADLYRSETSLPASRDVVGVAVRTIETQWARVNLVWEPDLAAAELFLTQPQYCRVVAMPIPNKGVLFSEPLSKTGSAEHYQVYGELGIDYRHEVFHAVIDDLAA